MGKRQGKQLSQLIISSFMILCFLKKPGPRELLGGSNHVGDGMTSSLASGPEA